MKYLGLSFLLTILVSMMGTTAFAHHFEVANAYGVTIYYLKTSDTEVAVSCKGSSSDLIYYNEYAGDVVIPKSVTYNGVTYSVTSIGEKAFCRCSGLTSVTIPNSVTSIGSSAFEECSGLYAITFPNSVTSIGDNAFYNCTYLNYVTIPNSVTSIGYSAFEGCSSLTYITIPNSVTRIENYTFYGCISLNSVTIPNSVISIGKYAFQDCSSLTSIEIPNSVTSIGGSAFYGCSKLLTIVIGNGIQAIGTQAFYNCLKINDVYCYTVKYPKTESDAFTYFYPVDIIYTTLHVPAEAVSQYKSVAPWSLFKSVVPLTDSDPKPTGINSIKVDEQKGKWYTLDGKQNETPRKGLNIVRMNNGKTKKVLVK